jgi:TM2 domain-containing membrane protein YozV
MTLIRLSQLSATFKNFILKQLIKSILLPLVILVSSVCCNNNVYSQSNVKNDTITKRTHSPKKATLLALIPGAGQIYNKKYWKLPIVYAGFAVTGYFAAWNRANYLKFNQAYRCKVNNPDNQLIVTYNPDDDSYYCSLNNKVECDNELAKQYETDQLKAYTDSYRRDMEFSYILMGLWYVIQMLDATVDAHLYYWNVNEDLSVRLEPVIMQPTIAIPSNIPNSTVNHNGLKISVNF